MKPTLLLFLLCSAASAITISATSYPHQGSDTTVTVQFEMPVMGEIYVDISEASLESADGFTLSVSDSSDGRFPVSGGWSDSPEAAGLFAGGCAPGCRIYGAPPGLYTLGLGVETFSSTQYPVAESMATAMVYATLDDGNTPVVLSAVPEPSLALVCGLSIGAYGVMRKLRGPV
jgi:hypothetical protein